MSNNLDRRLNKNYLILIIVSSDENTIKLSRRLMDNLGLKPRVNLNRFPEPYKPLWRLNLGKQKEIKSFLDQVKPCIKNAQRNKNRKIYK